MLSFLWGFFLSLLLVIGIFLLIGVIMLIAAAVIFEVAGFIHERFLEDADDSD